MKSDRFQEIGHVEGQTLLLCFFFGKDCEKKLHFGNSKWEFGTKDVPIGIGSLRQIM
jgi:hypothetical protein